MAAASVHQTEAPAVPVPDETVEQIFAESVVVVSAESVATTDAADEAPVDEAPEAPVAPKISASADPFLAASETLRARVSAPAACASVFEGAAASTAAAPVEHVIRRRPRALRKVVAAGASVGVMGLAGLLAVSMTLPSEAIAAVQGTQSIASASLVSDGTILAGGEEISEDEIQAFVASSDVENDSLAREGDYSAISLVDLAAEQGIRYSDSLYVNDPNAAIQWPFVVGVGMSSGYGQRWGRLHAGIDLVPGEGAPIQAIAAGTVRIATESGGAYGVTVYIDHIIDGELVTSHYAHMQYGSLRVKAGDTVEVGDIVGLVGNTGRSYGAHLHFEIIINGSTTDPLPWMQEHAGRYDGVTAPE